MVGARGFEPPTTWPPAWWGFVRHLSPGAVSCILPRHFRVSAARSCRPLSPSAAEMAVQMAVQPSGPDGVRSGAEDADAAP